MTLRLTAARSISYLYLSLREATCACVLLVIIHRVAFSFQVLHGTGIQKCYNNSFPLIAEYFKTILKAKFSTDNVPRKTKEEASYIYFMDFLEECEGTSKVALLFLPYAII